MIAQTVVVNGTTEGKHANVEIAIRRDFEDGIVTFSVEGEAIFWIDLEAWKEVMHFSGLNNWHWEKKNA